MPNVTVGRQIEEGDILYTALTEDEFRKYKEFKDYLEGDIKTILKEILDGTFQKYKILAFFVADYQFSEHTFWLYI